MFKITEIGHDKKSIYISISTKFLNVKLVEEMKDLGVIQYYTLEGRGLVGRNPYDGREYLIN